MLGLLLSDDEYRLKHEDVEFSSYAKRPKIYDNTIAVDASAGVRAQAEAVHQAKLEDWKFFDCAQSEVRNFIIGCVEDTWIRELRVSITGYALVPPCDIMDHL